MEKLTKAQFQHLSVLGFDVKEDSCALDLITILPPCVVSEEDGEPRPYGLTIVFSGGQWYISYDADVLGEDYIGLPTHGEDLGDSLYRFACCNRINRVI